MTRTYFKKRAAAIAVASCLSLTPWLAEAASLGKITVFSGLGQPLRAEIELNATRAELTEMNARLAAMPAFREAGIDYAPVLLDLRFAIDKRNNGAAVVKVSSAKPVYEPFIDVLVELSWPGGPLLREYTFLLDPPEVAAKAAARQAATADARPLQVARGASPAVESNTAGVGAATVTAPRGGAGQKRTGDGGTHVVEKGETLRKIAGESKYEGVTLEQMLLGLYRENPSAFVGANINRMRAGAILSIPDKAKVDAIPWAEAKQVYVAHTGDWNAYRQKLAAATARAKPEQEAVTQSVSGRITARVDEKPSAVDQAKDQVKVSRTEAAGKGGAGGKPGRSEEEWVAKDQALKEAEARVALLEKNISDLQKLVDMKTQLLAELQQQVMARKGEAPAAPALPAKPTEVVPAPAPVPAAAEAPKPAEAVKPVEPSKAPEEVKPAPPAEPVKAPEAKTVAVPAKPAAPPPPAAAAESKLLDDLLADPLPLIGGGGIIALLAGYLLLRRRRSEPEPELEPEMPAVSSVGPSSVFRMTGAQSVDTGNAPLPAGEFSQVGLAAIDTDEVDPVAEADVYMAYGRDAQAEEILIEALRKDPQRTATHVKLFEIYAKNKSVKQFDTLASEFYAQTGGIGPEWEAVAAMGAALDPDNPLYSDGRGARGAADKRGQSVAANVVAMTAAPAVGKAAAEEFVATVADTPAAPVTPLDFDLGGGSQPSVVAVEPAAPDVIDFDLAGVAPDMTAAPEAVSTGEPSDEQDFTETLVAVVEPEQASTAALPVDQATAAEEGSTTADADLADFTIDFDIAGEQPLAGAEAPAAGEPAQTVPEFDFSSINLDLGARFEEPDQAPVAPSASVSEPALAVPSAEDVSTKLALAKAYDEMGDQEQACELLREVIAEGSGEVVGEAREILARLGG